ncbi:Meiotic recombination protein rec14 [Lachnellula arida]|uniref:Meiotic recombination protein rec14 n=1 Tax=Lachnellula arida TaxID=1316785 RepID=A0A8T9BGQ9_9HELO|nr:Meiotic recombination protein rec14 [Lachnellula arida]
MASAHVTARSILSSFLPRLSAPTASTTSRNTVLFSRQLSLPLLPRLAFAIPSAIQLNVPGLLEGIWESILRAVPKKKTSHMKQRSRRLAGKGLQDVTSLNKCSACGNVKRAHYLCPFCVGDIKSFYEEKTEREKAEKAEKKLKKSEEKLQKTKSDEPSKQYLTTHTVDDAHITDIFSLAVTPTQVLSASGASSLKIHSTTTPDIPLTQTLTNAHKLGCHHIVTSRNGRIAASAGFGGEVKIWNISESSEWEEAGRIEDGNKAGEIWAIALSEDGQYLAATTYDGRINVWDLVGERKKIREYETKGSFGMCIDVSRDGRFTASGHENGAVYVFNNDTGRMLYSLPGLVKPVRTVAFSPAGTRLAAAGDARVIALYDVQHGEQVADLTGHSAWIFSIDWSDTGEYLLSGSFDGKVKVWSIDRRVCVATHSETDKTLWCVKWLPKVGNKSEAFATAGANRSISFYREATGG